MKYAKLIREDSQSITVKFGDGTISKLDKHDNNLGRSIRIINAKFQHPGSYKLNIDFGTFVMYKYLCDRNSEVSKKLLLKARALGIADKIMDNSQKDIIIADYNCNIRGRIRASTIRFMGEIPLKTDTGSQILLIGDTVIIDNQCIMSNILPYKRSLLVVTAGTYILRHKFVDLYTIDEIEMLFRLIYDMPDNNEMMTTPSYYYNKILIDLDSVGISVTELEEYTVNFVKRHLNRIGKEDILHIGDQLFALYATVFSMYESANFNSTVLLNTLNKVDAMIQDCPGISYYNKERYDRLKTEIDMRVG